MWTDVYAGFVLGLDFTQARKCGFSLAKIPKEQASLEGLACAGIVVTEWLGLIW